MIKLVRIDYRLVHGQVVFTWVNNLNLKRLVVIDDQAAKDENQSMALKMSVPQGVRFNLFTVEDALARKNKLSNIKDNTALIFGNVENCLKFMKEFDSPIYEINYGAIPGKGESKEFDKAIYLNDQEIRDSLKLIDLNYNLYSQQTPSSSKKSLNSMIIEEEVNN